MAEALTAESILAAASSATEVLAGWDAALAEAEQTGREFEAANEAAAVAMLKAQEAAQRLAVWSEAVDCLHAANKFLTQLESN